MTWDQEYKRKRTPMEPIQKMGAPKKIEIPNVEETIARADAALQPPKKLSVYDMMRGELAAYIKWLETQPGGRGRIFMFMVTGCECFLEDKE